MNKETKTSKQLAAIVRERMGDAPISHLEVRSDPTYGWAPFVVAHPERVGELQARAEKIAMEWRGSYEFETSIPLDKLNASNEEK